MIGASSDIGTGSILTVKDGGSFASSDLTINGVVELSGPTSVFDGDTVLGKGAVLYINNAQVGGSGYSPVYFYGANAASGGLDTVDKGAFVVGNGTIYPVSSYDPAPLSSETITNDGLIIAVGGTLKVLGSLIGSGTLGIASGSTLELGGNSSNNIVFMDQATLLIDKGAHETGFLQNFGLGDSVDLAGQAVTSVTASASGTSTVLDLYDGSTLSDQLTLKGHMTLSDFHLAKDGTGGTVVMLEPHAFHTLIPSL